MATCTYNPSFKHVPKSELRPGMIVVCGDEEHDATGCWKNKNHAVAPFKILGVNSDGQIQRLDLNGDEAISAPRGCDCNDKNHLYLFKEVTITPAKTPMSSLIQSVRELFLSEPEKSLQHFGITNADNELTADGKEIFIQWLFKQNLTQFNTDIVEKLKNKEAEEKK